MRLERTTAPASEPLTTTEAELQLSISTGYDTANVSSKIEAARNEVEEWTDRALINQTWKMTLDQFPEVIYLPKGKVQSITSFQYVDTAGATQTLVANTDYYMTSTGEEARLIPVSSWPSVHSTRKETVIVTWVSGYGASASNVPAWAKESMKAYLTMLYELRQDLIPFARQIMEPHRLHFDYSKNEY